MKCLMPIRAKIWQQARNYASSGSKRSSRFGATFNLDHFLQRRRALLLWRQVLRSTRCIADENTRKEMRQLARDEFERNKAVTDLTQIRYLISTGKTQWESVERYIEGL